MMKTLPVLLCAWLAGGVFAGAALAQQYKWVDKDGRVQYGDHPPAGVKATPMRPPAGPAVQGPAAAKALTPAEKDAEFKKRREDAAKAKEKDDTASADAQAKKANCANAQEAMRTLEIGRVRRIDSKGEPYYLDDAQLEAEKARTRKSIADFCS